MRETAGSLTPLGEWARDFALLGMGPDGRITFWAEGARRLVGYEEAEVLGRHFGLLATPEDRAGGLPERELRTAADTGAAADENWIVRKDGTRFWATGFSAARRDPGGALTGFVKVFRDLTDRQQAKEALREGELRLRAALAAADMGTWLWQVSTDKQTLDENLHRLVGLAEGRTVHNLDDFLTLIHPDDRAAVREAFGRSVRDGVPLQVEFRVVRPDGSVRWLRDKGEAVKDAQSRVQYLTGACVDVTDSRAVADELRRARDELERRVEERTAELRAAQEHMVRAERLAAIGQTVAGLAHESRNALQRVQACLSLLELRVKDRPEELDLLRRAQVAQDDVHRLFEGVRQYAAPIRIDPAPCDLAETWRQAWDDLSWRAGWERAELHEETGGVDLQVVGDAGRLKQVFRNLFENALTAGGDPLRVVVTCRVTRLGSRPGVRVAVRDNGPGFPPGARDKLFEPFFTTKTHGTGLGLPISRRIAEAHGGTLEASAGDGPGAEVILTLPRGNE